MKRLSVLLLLVLSAGVAGAQIDRETMPALGMNITTPSYYDNMIYFNDVTRHGSDWISHNPENLAVWDDEREIPLTANGYPASLQPDQAARQIVFLESEIAPRGDYTLTWAGSGTISVVIDFDERITFGAGDERRQTVTVDPPEGQVHLFIVIEATDPADPVRDVRLYLPGTDENSPRFTSWLLERLAPFGIARMMDWNWGSYSERVTWDERPRLTWASWGAELSGFIGVPYEVQVELANTLGIDLWVSLPYLVDDDYVRNAAELIRETLNPDLRVWVEYSNEAWNPIFPVFEHLVAEAERVAAAEGLEDHYVYHQYARRTGEIMAIFDDVFRDQPERMVGVIAGQAGWGDPARFIADELRRQGTVDLFDVFAIAPYFGDTWETSVGDINALVNDFYADATYSEDEFTQIFAALDEGLGQLFGGVGEYGEAMQVNREVAASLGLPLVTYEAGQHLVAGYFGSGAPDGAYIPVNAHPRMYDIYRRYLDEWAAFSDGGTMILFHLGGFWNESETFGHLRNAFQPIEAAHKYRAVVEWLAEQ